MKQVFVYVVMLHYPTDWGVHDEPVKVFASFDRAEDYVEEAQSLPAVKSGGTLLRDSKSNS